MDAQNPTSPAEKQPEEKDEAKVSQKHWPWIVGGMVIACIMLWNQHIADNKEIRASDKEQIKDARNLAESWRQLARERAIFRAQTSYWVDITNDTSLLYSFDSIAKAQQPK